MVYEVIRETKF